MSRISEGITHPAIGRVMCRHCRQPQSHPCVNAEFPRKNSGAPNYTKTHKSRIKEYASTFTQQDINFVKEYFK